MLDRRALLLLAGATVPATLPSVVRAQQRPVTPSVPTPAPVLPPHPTVVPSQVPVPGHATASPPPHPPAPVLPASAIDKSKRYFVFFEQTIDLRTSRLLRLELTKLVEAGVSQITLVVHSPGGLLDTTLGLYSFIRALPARVDTHAVGFVMSAACVLFLAGERRTADRNARFMFHPSTAPMAGTFTAAQVQERTTLFAEVSGIESQIYHDRSAITDADIARFNAGPVYYTAEQARNAGIIQSVADLSIPGPQTAAIVFVE